MLQHPECKITMANNMAIINLILPGEGNASFTISYGLMVGSKS